MSLNKISTKYSISFTAGSLLVNETVNVLNYLLEGTIDEKIDEIVLTNAIQINSESARKRVLQEIRKRYSAVDKSVWELFNHVSPQEKKILLLYISIKTYKLLEDFFVEVIIEKWKSQRLKLGERDIEIFLDKKSNKHSEIETWSDSTRGKVLQVILRILKESGILINGNISPLEAPDYFWEFFVDLGDPWFLDLALLAKNKRDRITGVI